MIPDIDTVDYQPDVIFEKNSQDLHINSHGRKLLELCKSANMRIVNGRLHDDKHIGSYTFCNSVGASVIDYLMANEIDFNCI